MRLSAARSAGTALLAAALAACGSDGSSGPQGGPPYRLIVVSGDLQTGAPGAPLPITLKVRAETQSAAASPGALVTWSIVSGSATVSTDTSRTNNAGEATVTVQLGVVLGPVVVRASVGDSVPDLDFREMNGDPCNALPVMTANDTVTADLWPIDCRLVDNTPVDFYELTIATTSNVTFTLKATDWEPYIFLFDTAGFPIALTLENTVGDSVQVRAVMAPGKWIVGPNTYDANADGPYTMTALVQPLDVTSCALTWLTRGTDVQQSTGTQSCQVPTGTTTSDVFFVVSEGGKPIVLAATAAGFTAALELRDGNYQLLSSGTAASAPGQSASLSYTPANSDFFVVVVKGSNGASLPYQVSFH